ncbi:MAG: TOBE domain-containing protein [Clostridia bacterium]|nr:TOBE domain-containing protein [Clostridia bacterium]
MYSSLSGSNKETSILPGTMLEDYRVEICGRLFECVDKGFGDDQKVGIVVRPEDIEIKPEKEGFLKGKVKSCVFKGVHYEMTIEQVNYPYTWLVHSTDAADVDDIVGMCFYPNDIHVMRGEDIDYSVFSAVPEEVGEE